MLTVKSNFLSGLVVPIPTLPLDKNVVFISNWLNSKCGISVEEVRIIPDVEKTIINNNYIGDTPYETKLKVGTYNIMLTKEGYAPIKKKIIVDPGFNIQI